MNTRIVFSIYSGIGYATVCLVPSMLNPLIFQAMKQEGLQYWRDTEPIYPLGWYVIFFALPVLIILHFLPKIMSLIKIETTPLNRTVSVFLFFSLAICLQVLNIGLDVAFLFWGCAYACILGLIEGLNSHNFDMSFINNDDLPLEAKLHKLGSMTTKWFKGLNIITGVLIAAAISGGIHFLTFNPSFMGKLGRTYGNTGMIIEILVIAPGIIIGIFWKIFHKINVIESQYEMIKHH